MEQFLVVSLEMIIILPVARPAGSAGSCGRLRDSLLQKLKGRITRGLNVGVYELWGGLRSDLIFELSFGHLLARRPKLGLVLVNLTVANVVVLSPFGPRIRPCRGHLGVTE